MTNIIYSFHYSLITILLKISFRSAKSFKIEIEIWYSFQSRIDTWTISLHPFHDLPVLLATSSEVVNKLFTFCLAAGWNTQVQIHRRMEILGWLSAAHGTRRFLGWSLNFACYSKPVQNLYSGSRKSVTWPWRLHYVELLYWWQESSRVGTRPRVALCVPGQKGRQPIWVERNLWR